MLSAVNKLLLGLNLLPGIGRQKIKKIFIKTGPILNPEQDLLRAVLGLSNYNQISQFFNSDGHLYKQVSKIELELDRNTIRMINYSDKQYPFLLAQIADFPVVLFYKGDVDVLSRRQIAIVGSRNASSSSLRHAYRFARELSQLGLVITSGLAQGVDSAAHAGAVDHGGSSIAVMGTGLDKIYPYRNRQLAHQLLNKGCWVSEYLPGSSPLAANFPRRNRIISGLALGVLVIEARSSSGTLITARTALEQNREVFAVPGPIDYQGSVGCHRLIAQGAKLVQSIDDIMDEIEVSYPLSAVEAIPLLPELEPALAGLLELIDYQPMQFSLIGEKSVLSEVDLLSMLVELELLGYIDNGILGISRIK